MTFFKSNKRYLISAASAVIVIALLIVASPAIHRQLDDWKLLPRPERLSELYFTDHTKLPNSYTPGTPQTVSFTIHNLEYRDTTYDYRVVQYAQDGSKAVELNGGKVTLKQGEFARPVLQISPSDLGKKNKNATTGFLLKDCVLS